MPEVFLFEPIFRIGTFRQTFTCSLVHCCFRVHCTVYFGTTSSWLILPQFLALLIGSGLPPVSNQVRVLCHYGLRFQKKPPATAPTAIAVSSCKLGGPATPKRHKKVPSDFAHVDPCGSVIHVRSTQAFHAHASRNELRDLDLPLVRHDHQVPESESRTRCC